VIGSAVTVATAMARLLFTGYSFAFAVVSSQMENIVFQTYYQQQQLKKT